MVSTYPSKPRTWLHFIPFAFLLVAALPVGAQDFEPFIGEFEGRAVSDTNGEISPRDIRVAVKPAKKGFTVEWVTVIHKPGGRVKRAQFSIEFQSTRRPNIYSSAMRRNLFGKAVPMDPMKGDPYVWAKIDGKSMSVYALIITDEGGYELQTHQRTLTEEGMKLEFSRVRDGEVLRTVTGSLTRLP